MHGRKLVLYADRRQERVANLFHAFFEALQDLDDEDQIVEARIALGKLLTTRERIMNNLADDE